MTERLRPFFSYFGAKYNLAPKYPAPRHDTVIEWYAGSAQYALLHHKKDVVLFEAYAPVAELWRYLISATEREILALPDLGPGITVDSLGLAPGPSYLIGYWCNAACARPRQSLTVWSAAAQSQLFWGQRVRERIAAQLPAIKHWTVYEAKHEEANPGELRATHFVDPPYVKAGHAYGVAGVDYTDLAGRCETALGQVIVCEASGADWLPFSAFATTKARNYHGARVSNEVVWCK